MSPLEQFIIRHKAARYAFVLISWPFEAIRDRAKRIWNPVGVRELRNALDWARRGGDPTAVPERPEPAPLHPRWQNRR
jgi:hypothetical protein